MNENYNELQQWSNDDEASLYEDETLLERELVSHMSELSGLEEDFEKIGSPDTLGETVMNVVWDQFINQIGIIAGEDFVKANRGLTLDLRSSAHIQTTENFANGKIASHNSSIDYQERYDGWQSKLQHDENGNVVTHTTRSGREEANLVKGARAPFDKGRPSGSVEKGTDMDHTIPAGEIICDAAANAHMSEQEQIDFANSESNLHEMKSSHNRSKGRMSTKEWLDYLNSKGQKPSEQFADPMADDYLSPELEAQYRKDDEEAREEYGKRKSTAEQRSIETGKQSQKAEAFRIGGKALRSVLMGLLAALIKDIIKELISWFRSGKRKISTFTESVKKAIKNFISNMKQHLTTARDTFLSTLVTAICGPIVGMLKKAWVFLKQGYRSIKEAIQYFKNPANKDKSFGTKMLEVGKIIIAGLTAVGAIALGEVIEKALTSIPIFAVQIPLLGSLASLLGIFFGALGSGLVGALALNLIDRLIAKRQKEQNKLQQLEKKNEILNTQTSLLNVSEKNLKTTEHHALYNIKDRHKEGAKGMRDMVERILSNSDSQVEEHLRNNEEIDEIFNTLKSI